MAEGRLLVGTSGWSYDHWRGRFYPEHLAHEKRLAYYAGRFGTVEVNASFYGLPAEKTVLGWRDSVPDGFVFAMKGSRYVTHMRKLADVSEPVERFVARVLPLGAKLGPVLWQLPPFLQRDLGLLAGFLGTLPRELRHAIEFRNESWLEPETFSLLSDSDVAIVHVSGDMLRTDLTPTASFVYARFHGTTRYHGSYSPTQLEPWAAFLRIQLKAGRDCYAYYNNDAEGHAPADAQRLLGMLGERT